MTLEEFRMPASKKPFKAYLESLHPEVLVNPGDIFSCFFCGFVRATIEWPPGKNGSIQFLWDSYIIKSNERDLPEWAKQFTCRAQERAVVDCTQSQHVGKLTPKVALEILRQC